MRLKLRYILYISIAFICHCGIAQGQSEQNGIVLEYNGEEAKTPLANVAISATNAGSTVSDDKGLFVLKFRTLKAGDNIVFRRIEKNGFEVMNREAIEAMKVGRGNSSKAIEILLCKSETLSKLREGYRSVAAQRYERKLKEAEAEINKLKSEGKLKESEYNSRLNSIEEEYENKLSRIEPYIDRFARIDMTQLDDSEREIIVLVQDGLIDEAIEKYEDMKLTEQLKQGIADLRVLQSAQKSISETEQAKEEEMLRLKESIEAQLKVLQSTKTGEQDSTKINELIREAQKAITH